MPRLAVANMAIGFFVLFFAAAAGAFLASDITAGYLRDKAILDSWTLALSKSSHGHTNLFALTHVAFGLTMPYSTLSPRVKLWQTIGFAAGTVGMGPGMLVRAYIAPAAGLDAAQIVVGLLLSCALAAFFTHGYGLAAKAARRA